MIDANQVQFGDKVYGSPGGSSAVYKGAYTPINADGGRERFQAAIKELTLPANNTQAFLGNVMQEVIIQSKLDSCELICKCYGYFTNENKVYIVMEWLEHDLEHDIKTRNGEIYPEAQLTAWMYHVLQALMFAREKVRDRQNIAHRDIKPQNILLTFDRKVKLVDFGSGTIADGRAQTLTGTPLYMSPEQIPFLQEFQRTGQLPPMTMSPYKSDVYSLGVTFLQMALLEPPVKLLLANRDAALQEYVGMIQGHYPVLCGCLYYMLQSDPAQRPDIPQILSYLQNPANFVALTVTQKPEVSTHEVNAVQAEPQCSNCGHQLPDMYWMGEYYMCRNCYNQVQSAQQALTAEAMLTSQSTEAMPTPDQIVPESTSAPSSQVFHQCSDCTGTGEIEIPDKEFRIWFCKFCYAPTKVNVA